MRRWEQPSVDEGSNRIESPRQCRVGRLGPTLVLLSPAHSLAIGQGDADGDGHPNVGVLAFDLDGRNGPVVRRPLIRFTEG